MRFLDTSAASPRKTASGTSSGGISTRPLASAKTPSMPSRGRRLASRASRANVSARVGASASVSNVGFERAVATHGAFVRLARVGELAFEFSSMSPAPTSICPTIDRLNPVGTRRRTVSRRRARVPRARRRVWCDTARRARRRALEMPVRLARLAETLARGGFHRARRRLERSLRRFHRRRVRADVIERAFELLIGDAHRACLFRRARTEITA